MTFKWFLFRLFWDFFFCFMAVGRNRFSRFGSMSSRREFYGIYFTFRALLIKAENQTKQATIGRIWITSHQSAWVAPRVDVTYVSHAYYESLIIVGCACWWEVYNKCSCRIYTVFNKTVIHNRLGYRKVRIIIKYLCACSLFGLLWIVV